MTEKVAIGQAPFTLVYVTDIVILAKVGMPTYQVEVVSKNLVPNEEGLLLNLDLLDDKRDESAIRMAMKKQVVIRYYNSRVNPRLFEVGDLVLRKVFLNT